MRASVSKPARRMDREKRRAAILKAASELFYEKGYRGTSLNAIVRRAGGSKRNFYTEFGGKEGLFKTLVTKSIERKLDEQAAENDSGKDLREALVGAARRILEGFTDPELMGLYRIAILDGLDFPEVAEAFFEAAPGRAEENIAQLLEKAARKGEVIAADYAEAASCFVGMLHRKIFFELLLGLRDALWPGEGEAFVSSTVALFLGGLAVRNG